MAVRKPTPKPTPNERAIQDRVMRARRANPPRDPTGEHHEAVAEIAKRVGRDVSDLLDDWDHFAAIIEYDGNTTRAEAERRAVDQVRALVLPQAVLL